MNQTDNSIFDSVFRTMMEKVPEVVIPLINEMFGRDYPPDEPFTPYRNEHETPKGRIATDSFFKVRGRYYHIECQSTADATMVVRMIEYDFAIAMEEALRNGAPYRMRMPASGVLYLRDVPSAHSGLDIEVELPYVGPGSGGMFTYHVRTLFAHQYGSPEIFAKRLLVLLPFYIMRYERELPAIAGSAERTQKLLAECRALRAELENVAVAEGNADLYERLVELVIRISDHLLAKQVGLRKEVRASMGGEVLELMVDKIKAAEEEARAKGLKEGRDQGLKKGMKEGEKRLAERLRALGVDEETLQKALADAQGEE